jgi:hypothetical protein
VSLVVAQIHDGGVSLVADTKITRSVDATWTRQVFKNACPKLMTLRDDVAVGITGVDPVSVLRRLVGLRYEPIENLIEAMTSIDYASFVVATLDPSPRLWKVSDGSSEERSSIGRCWAGDHGAYEIFQQRYHEWSEKLGSAFRLMSSMQWLLSFNPVESVGGYLTMVATTSEGFRFVANPMTVGPWFLEGLSQAMSDGFRLTFSVPHGGDPNGHQVLPAVGRPPTVGALAYYVPQAGVAWLFCHESPWEPIPLNVDSMAKLIELAAAKYGQTLAGAKR